MWTLTPSLHSIHKVLSATLAHPEFFSPAARRARVLSVPGGKWDPERLAEYDRDNRWEPTARQLRELKKDLAPHKAKFDEIYRPIRDQIAHIILKDFTEIADLYDKTKKAEIDGILCFLHSLIAAIRHMAYNGQPFDIKADNYGYGKRVAEISRDTERLLRSIA